jgi:hypothetical protein
MICAVLPHRQQESRPAPFRKILVVAGPLTHALGYLQNGHGHPGVSLMDINTDKARCISGRDSEKISTPSLESCGCTCHVELVSRNVWRSSKELLGKVLLEAVRRHIDRYPSPRLWTIGTTPPAIQLRTLWTIVDHGLDYGSWQAFSQETSSPDARSRRDDSF